MGTPGLGSRGLVRADLVRREWGDFYGTRRDLTTGKVDTTTGPADVGILGNFADAAEREYLGLITSFRYRVSDRLNVAVNYTWSEVEGNFTGEAANSAANPALIEADPEYKEASWNYPTGPLGSDQEHTLRAWAIYNIIDNDRHKLNVSWLENYFSGNPYSATITVDPRPFVDNPGYADPPSALTYFTSARGAFTTDSIHRSDLSLNYSFVFPAWGRDLEIFIQPEVINVFDEDGVIDVSTSTRRLQAFDPFNTVPVEGVDWEKRSTFGQPINENDFQDARTFRFSVGIRF